MSATATSAFQETGAEGPATPQAGFLAAVLREAGYRRCLVLDGNVRDVFADGRGGYLRLADLLVRRLGTLQAGGQPAFTVCGRWDRVDGLRFPTPLAERAFLRGVTQKSDGASASRDDEPAEAYDDGSPEPASPGGSAETGGHTPGPYPQPEEALPAMRQLLAHPVERAAFVLDWSEHLVGNTTHLDPDERQLLTILAKTLAEGTTPAPAADAGSPPAGLLILITGTLAALPSSLYQDNPNTKVITVPRPGRPQRLAFFETNQRDLRVTPPKPAPGRPAHPYAACGPLLGEMADLTEGLTLVDLRHVLALSQQLPSPLRADRLVNLYKLGEQRSPWEDLDPDRLDAATSTLTERVIGQDEAVHQVATMLVRAYMGLAGLQHSAAGRKPRGTLFFVGPTGVGKTELAKATAAFLFGDENACLRFDMSEYAHAHDDQRLVGAPPSYVGFEEGGQLTRAVRQQPFCVLLFDEIEKAHPRVLDKFLQILEDGRLTDGRGETTYFSETVIIFTSNIGADAADPSLDRARHEAFFKDRVCTYFAEPPRPDGGGGLGRPELLSRLGENNIVVFNPITDPGVRRTIFSAKLTGLQQSLCDRFGLETEVTDRCLDWLARRSETRAGGRDLINGIEQHLLNPLTRYLFQRRHQLTPGRRLRADVPDGESGIQFELHEGDSS